MSIHLKKFIGIACLFLFILSLSSLSFIGTYSCGGSSSSSDDDTSDDFMVETTVSRAQATSSSLSALTYGGSNKAITLEVSPKKGDSVQIYDLDDIPIGEPCVTDSEGKCPIVITQEEAAAGFVLKATGDGLKGPLPEIGIVIQPSQEELDAGSISPAITPDGAVTAAITKKLCDGDLVSCKASKDLECITKALPTTMPENPETAANQTEDTLERQIGALMVSARTASTQSGDEVPSLTDLMVEAFEGDSSRLADLGGNEIGDNKIKMSDASTNVAALTSKINESYCTTNSDTGKSTWQEVKELDTENFNPTALAGFFKEFSPTEINDYDAAQFQAFAKSLPKLENGFTTFSNNTEAQKTVAKYFTQGAFEDGTTETAIAALGMMASTFPQATDGEEFDWTSFDPDTAAKAAYNSLLELKAAGTLTFDDPDTLVTNFQSIFSNLDNQRTFAVGSATLTEMMGDFINEYSSGTFSATDYAIEAPSGATCNTNDDCPPCHICDAVAKTCNPISTSVGATCSQSTDCGSSSPLTCVIPLYSSSGYCMCTTVVPTGISVAGSSEGSNETFDSSDTPTTGSVGSSCTSNSQCSGSSSCVGSVCVASDGTFKKAPGAPCSADTECESNSCTNNTCATPSTTQIESKTNDTTSPYGKTEIGGACTTNLQCSTFNCVSGFCASASTGGTTTGTTGGTTTTTSGGTTTTTSGGTPSTTYSGAWTPSGATGTKCPKTVSLSGKGTGPYTSSVGITANFPTATTCSGSLTANSCSSCAYTAGTGATNTGAKVVLSSCSGTCTGLTMTKD